MVKNSLIIQAIENKNIIQFYYKDDLRKVEPHCYGITRAGNEGLRAFEIESDSSSGTNRMKMYDLGKAIKIEVLEDTFMKPRPDYKKGDKGMSEIFVEL
ncbi:MAG: hypothetical protein PHP27_01800 [Bacteroidales bacterium]|nr:hypothetical protein [Bacteroidales bacterium]